MNTWRFAPPKIAPKEILAAVLIGFAGFGLNMFELQLGWGMHFIFGNALVYAFFRVFSRYSLVLAISISSLWTIFLWNHPWAWMIWIGEVIFLTWNGRKNAPVRNDVIFWFLLGTPLLLLAYGAVMAMDELSLLLVVVKQSVNGILNVVLGELIYVTIVIVNPLRKFGHWPKLRAESAITTLLMAIILIPTCLFFALDAPQREKAARTEVGKNLEYQIQVSSSAINGWVQSRSMVLQMHAAEHFNDSGTQQDRPLDALSPDFDHITIAGNGWRKNWSAPSPKDTFQLEAYTPSEAYMMARNGVRLVATRPQSTKQGWQFILIVPFMADGKAGVIVAQLRDGLLSNIINIKGQSADFSEFLYSPVQGWARLTQNYSPLSKQVEALSNAQVSAAAQAPTLLSDVGYGNAIMSDLREARMIRATDITELSEWKIVAVAPLAPAVLQAREIQLKQLAALMGFVLLVALIAVVLSRRVAQTLNRLSESAGDLVAFGMQTNTMDNLVISEINEISGMIASVRTTVGRERGAYAQYQRRLDSIAQHAPVIIYALDVVNGAKGSCAYVSQSLQKILGYSTADAMAPGWWSHAVHPEDYQSCVDAFTGLETGKVVSVEYRLQHKNGHFVWVYDTLSVEANPQSDALEAVGMIMDISERKAATEQLLQADKMASLGRMISGTAHEINQPLNFIKMAALNLRQNTVRGHMEADRFLLKIENVLAQVERASAILLQMRVFGRTPKESPYPIAVKASVDAVMTMVAPQFELDGTVVLTSEKGDPAYIQALPVLFEQVLLNLLLNANDAILTRQRAGSGADGKIKITVERRSELAVITVEDNGTGLSAEVLRNIFEPFYTTKAPREGTGLGLSISYGIIRDLGGLLSAKSGPNGAIFVIELPLADNRVALVDSV
jgi:PAS domain S-box-containing protein